MGQLQNKGCCSSGGDSSSSNVLNTEIEVSEQDYGQPYLFNEKGQFEPHRVTNANYSTTIETDQDKENISSSSNTRTIQAKQQQQQPSKYIQQHMRKISQHISNNNVNSQGGLLRAPDNHAKQQSINAKSSVIRSNTGSNSFTSNHLLGTNDLIITDNYPQYLQTLAECILVAPQLKLTIVSSTTLRKGLTLSINCQGMQGSYRNENDGYTFFGCKKRPKRQYCNLQRGLQRASNQQTFEEDGGYYFGEGLSHPPPLEDCSISKKERTPIINDFVIPNSDPEVSKKHRGRHFYIYYNVQSNVYKIKDLGIGFGAFYKLENPLILKENHLINMGLIFVVVNFSRQDQILNEDVDEDEESMSYNSSCKHNKNPKGNDEDGGSSLNESIINCNAKLSLKLKFFGGPCNGEVVTIRPEQAQGKYLTLGRSKECSLHFEDHLLSKCQCCIEYGEKTGWLLRDGKENRKSTNGTWLYLSEEHTIYDGMVFKASQTIFQIQLN